MSLNIISGLPRNGKSYYCCTRMIDDLVNDKRSIYTNLPINPDVIARVVAVRLCPASEYYLDRFEDTLRRIHLFITFKSIADYRRFKKINPRFCALHRARSKQYDNDLIYSQRLFFAFELLVDYWNYCRANSIFYFDECYQIWNYLDQSERSGDAKDRRKELQNYMRMHGHDKDDIFLITHKERDLDRFILDTCSYRINVRNSKYWPVIPEEFTIKYWWLSWLASLRWPVQFFILRTFIGDEKTCHRSFFKRSSRIVFKCYNSHSAPNGLKNRGVSESAGSSDFKKGYFSELREWFFDALPALIILSLLVATAVGLYNGLKSMIRPSKKPAAVADSAAVAGVPGKVQNKDKQRAGDPVKDKTASLAITAVSPTALYYNDGTVLRIGDVHEVKGVPFTVIALNRSYVTFSCRGKNYQVRSLGIK